MITHHARARVPANCITVIVCVASLMIQRHKHMMGVTRCHHLIRCNVSILSGGLVYRDCYVSLQFISPVTAVSGSHIKLRSNLQQPLSSKLYWDKIVNVQNGQLSSHSDILIFRQFNWQIDLQTMICIFLTRLVRID